MKRTLIFHELDDFTLYSYDDGLAYHLSHPDLGQLFLQGEDAHQFENELAELTCGSRPLFFQYLDALKILWNSWQANGRTT